MWKAMAKPLWKMIIVAFPHLCTVNAYRRVTIETGETKWTFIHQTWTWGFNMVSEY